MNPQSKRSYFQHNLESRGLAEEQLKNEIDELRKELFTKDFCIESQSKYCEENHVHVDILRETLMNKSDSVEQESQNQDAETDVNAD